MINANDVINFRKKLIGSGVKMSVLTNNYFYEINTSDIRIYSTFRDDGCTKYAVIQFDEYNDIIVNDLTEREWLDLKRIWLDAKDYADNLAENQFVHYFDKINKIDKTIDNLDDDED